MAEHVMSSDEAARFLASRPPVEDETQAKAASPNGKAPREPQAASRPWRRDEKWIGFLAESLAKHTKAAIDAELAPLRAEIKALRSGGDAGEKPSLSHYDAAGNCCAELRRDGGRVCLRFGEVSVSAADGSERAAELEARFEAIGRELVP
jgi:hypothetical protein